MPDLSFSGAALGEVEVLLLKSPGAEALEEGAAGAPSTPVGDGKTQLCLLLLRPIEGVSQKTTLKGGV
jgi:hypothetical protein